MYEGSIAVQANSIQAGEFRMPSLTEQMANRKAHLEAQLAEVNKVLAGLERNPEAAELLDAISRLGGLR